MSGTLHQATCVAIGGRGVLIEGPPGAGQSSLALALIDRGAVLVGDDGVLLARRGERLHASPAPAIAGKLEVRNIGLLTYPTCADIPVALVLRLDPAAPRFRDAPEWLMNMPFNPRVVMENISRRELVEMYAKARGHIVPDMLFYYTFGTFKIAAICQQIYARYVKGFTRDTRFAGFDKFVGELGRIAARAIARKSL